MSDFVNVGYSAEVFESSPQTQEITGVRLYIDEDTYVEAGDDTGRVLEARSQYATTELAELVLHWMSGFHYIPYGADNAIVDPSAELGDEIGVAGITSLLLQQQTEFNSLHLSQIASPGDDDIDHEYPYKPQAEREFKRKVYEMGSRITQTATDITSEVIERQTQEALLASQITQTARELRLDFVDSMNGLYAYIRIVGGNIILGQENSKFQVVITNEKISFLDSGNEVAYVANNQFLTPHQVVQNELDLGGYQLDASDGIAFRWKGRE